VQCRKTPLGLLRLGARGDTFLNALCHEAGGRAGRGCEIFLDQLCSVAAASPNGRMAFRIYALQRLHAAAFRGAAMPINPPPGDAHGPRGPPGGLAATGAPPPPPRPVISFTTNLRSPHHAGCEASTFTNTHVPFIATARTTPGT
jgi:hypothetical protein